MPSYVPFDLGGPVTYPVALQDTSHLPHAAPHTGDTNGYIRFRGSSDGCEGGATTGVSSPSCVGRQM